MDLDYFALERLQLNFSQAGYIALNTVLAIVMFVVALGVDPHDFKKVLLKPKASLVGLIAQILLFPAFSFLLVKILQPAPSIGLGMILVACCPSGNVANFLCSVAKGNVPLSVCMTTFSTLLAIITTPFNFAIWSRLYTEASGITHTISLDAWTIISNILWFFCLPLVLGMVFAKLLPRLKEKIIKPAKKISMVLFIGFLLMALLSNVKSFIEFIPYIFIMVLIQNGIGFLTGFSVSYIFRLSKEDRRSVSLYTGILNSGLGLSLIFNPETFNGNGGMAFIAAWWGIWHIIPGLGIALVCLRRVKRSLLLEVEKQTETVSLQPSLSIE